MLDSFFIKFQRLKQNYHFKVFNVTLILLFGLTLSNKLLLCLLGLHNTAWPWSFIPVLRHGFIITTLMAFMLVYLPLGAVVFYYDGGIKRAIAQKMFVYWSMFLLLSALELMFFIHWEELNLKPYPWLIISLFLRLPEKSENHLIFCLLGSYSLL